MNPLDIARSIVEALEDKKGENIVLLDIHEIAYFTDYFVIASGTSDRMLDSLAQAAQEQIKSKYGIKGRIEGFPRDGWLVVDYGDVVLHLYSPDLRKYYDLEGLWEEGKVLVRVQ